MALNKFNMTTERKLLMTVKGSLLLKVTFQFPLKQSVENDLQTDF